MADIEHLNEKQRNHLMRRVDWRYLLSNPKPMKSICFNDGNLRKAVEAISDSLTSPDQIKSGECDLAVAINPTNEVLRSAFDALCPNGEFYTEWYMPWIGGAHGVRRRLEKMGFAEIVCYWAWPPPRSASPVYWIPIHSTNILQYYFASRPASSPMQVRIARFVLRIIVKLGLHHHILTPVCAIARTTSTDRQEGFQGSINKQILKEWQSWRLDKEPSQLNWLLQTPGHRLISKIVAMVFSELGEKPALVVKIPRSEIAARALTAEAHNLVRLSERKPLPKGYAPLLFTKEWKGILTVGEGFVDGLPLYNFLNQDNYRSIALRVTDWQIDLAGGTAPSPRSEWWDRLVGSAIRDFDQSFGSAFTTKELSYLRAALNRLDDMPLVFEQRDCSPWNILINRNGDITVLDWESAEPNGLPGLDLIYFLTYLSFFLQGAMESGRYIAAYRNSYDAESFAGKINKECQEKYCAQINIKPDDLRYLRLLTWLVHSRQEYQRLREDAGGEPILSALRQGLFSRLVREDITFLMESNE